MRSLVSGHYSNYEDGRIRRFAPDRAIRSNSSAPAGLPVFPRTKNRRVFGYLSLARAGAGPRKLWIVVAAVTLSLSACHQDPIFDMISREVKPQEPRIKGVPTKIVIFNRAASGPEDWGVYVGASSLHRYAQAVDGSGAVWDGEDIPQPPGKIFDLAATQNYLYALTGADSSKLYRLGGGSTEWEEVDIAAAGNQGFPRLQAIYGELNSEGFPMSDYLFVGTSNNSPREGGNGNFGIFYTDGLTLNGGLVPLVSDTALLTGAAYDGSSHYVSTNGDGVYYGSPPAGFYRIPPGELSLDITGLINTGSATLALGYEGDILRLSGGSLTQLNTNTIRFNFRGAAAMWNDGADTLLLAAVRNSDPIYGYREILIPGSPGEIEMRHPGDNPPTTVDDNKQFKDTVEPKPVNALLQVPALIDPNKVLLVSIQGTGQGTAWVSTENDTDGGLWSYRARDGIWQWNAEN